MHTDDGRYDQEQPNEDKDGSTRLQQGGEGGTTRFGMEDGDNTDIPATGPATREDDEQNG